MAVDALASSHPLSTPAAEVNTPAQISEMFDSISYSKVLSRPPRWSRHGGGHGEGGGDSASRGPTASGAAGAPVPARRGHAVLLAPSLPPGGLGPQDALRLPVRGGVQEGRGGECAWPAVEVRAGGGGFRPAPALCPKPQPTTEAEQQSLGTPALPSLWPVFPQSYLRAFAYNSTTYLDLWEHLQKVSGSHPRKAILGSSDAGIPGGRTCVRERVQLHCSAARAGCPGAWPGICRTSALMAP